MSDQDTLPKKAQKFFFDLNNFDDDHIEEEIEETPPPPVFSEAELESARREAYESGKKDALAEAATSREKFIADLLAKITTNLAEILKAEDARASLYEREAVTLSRAIFEKLFPALNEKHGLDEIEAVIVQVLESQSTHTDILLEVHSDYRDAIQSHLEKALNPLQTNARCLVAGNDALGLGDFRMGWKDGGAVRDSQELAGQIAKQLELVLADPAAVSDNSKRRELPAKDRSLTAKKPERRQKSAHPPASAATPETEIKDE